METVDILLIYVVYLLCTISTWEIKIQYLAFF